MPAAPTAASLGAALVLAGLGFGSPSLLACGIGLLGLAGLAVAWVALATPQQLVREPGPSRVVEEQPFALQVRAVGGRLPLFGGELSDPVLPAPIAVGPRWGRTLETEIRLEGRGRRRLGRTRLEVRDPLGLRARVVESADAGELLVLPRVEPVVAAGSGAGGATARGLTGLEDGGGGRLDARAIELEVDGLRPHREGSPASRIHWPAVARTGELIERRLVAGADAAPLVVLDSSRPAGPQALDAAVRAAGSLCVQLAHAGGCAVLLAGDRRPTEVERELRAWPQVHARLALIEAARLPPAVSRALRPGAVFWVTARIHPALPATLRSTSAARYLVAPSGAGRGAVAFTVAGCDGRRVGVRVTRSLGRAA